MINPINGMLLVKEEQQGDEVTVGGLIITAALNSGGPKRGEIIAVGSGETNHFTGGIVSMDMFSVGDKIIYADHAGVDVKDNGEEYILLHNKHVMAKLS